MLTTCRLDARDIEGCLKVVAACRMDMTLLTSPSLAAFRVCGLLKLFAYEQRFLDEYAYQAANDYPVLQAHIEGPFVNPGVQDQDVQDIPDAQPDQPDNFDFSIHNNV
jgi:hypothetical protein